MTYTSRTDDPRYHDVTWPPPSAFSREYTIRCEGCNDSYSPDALYYGMCETCRVPCARCGEMLGTEKEEVTRYGKRYHASCEVMEIIEQYTEAIWGA